METQFFVNALQLSVYLAACLLASIVAGGLVGAVFRTATQLDDPSIALLSRSLGLLLFLSFGAGYVLSESLAFAMRLWGGSDVY